MGIAGNPSGYQSLVSAFTWLTDTIKGGPGVWIGKLGTMFSSLWGVISANPIGVLVTVLGVLAVAIGTAFATSEEFRQKVSELWEKIKNDLKPVIDSLVGAVQNLWSWLKEKLTPLLQPLVSIAINFVGVLSELWDLIVGFVTLLSTTLSPAITLLWDKVLKPVADWLANTFVGTLKTIFNWIDSAISLFKSLLGKANEYIDATNKASNNTVAYKENFGNLNQRRINALDAFASGGLGINTAGLGAVYNGGTLQVTTNINVNNNGTPISETEIRKWGNTITEIVSDNLGRSFAV